MISKLIFWELAWIWTDLYLNLQPRVSKISSDFFEIKPYLDSFFILMMNLCFNSKNKRWIFMIFIFRVRSSIFSNLFNMFTLIHRLFTYSNLRWWLKLENEEVLEYTCWKMEIRTKKKDVEASSSFLRYILVETSKINRSFFVFSLFVSVIPLVLSSIPSLLTSLSLWSHRFVSWMIRCWNCRALRSMMKIRTESLRTARQNLFLWTDFGYCYWIALSDDEIGMILLWIDEDWCEFERVWMDCGAGKTVRVWRFFKPSSFSCGISGFDPLDSGKRIELVFVEL